MHRAILKKIEESHRDGRIAPRHAYHVSSLALIVGIAGARWCNIQTENLSVSGVGFLTDDPLGVGDKIIFCFRTDTRSLVVLAEVLHVHPCVSGQRRVGAKFLETSSQRADLEHFPVRWLGMTFSSPRRT